MNYEEAQQHKEVIKAWLDGAEIQCMCERTNWWWQDVETPTWAASVKYRVKPESEPKPKPKPKPNKAWLVVWFTQDKLTNKVTVHESVNSCYYSAAAELKQLLRKTANGEVFYVLNLLIETST